MNVATKLCKTGDVPPLTGLAVKVTPAPAQIAPGVLALMLTLAGKIGLTVTVIAFEVAGEPVIQLALEVITQAITSPLV
ncbi:MAG: hypothetical protein NTV54_02900, partial [Ignavibacteriales bacterium]|nr:hypothetical protein [Ignavibacteriales bacterium]